MCNVPAKQRMKYCTSENQEVTFKQILTTHRNSRPKIILKKKLNYKFLVSVSHEANIAIAIVIAFKK